MRTDEFDYDLPDEAIGRVPADPRDSARLLVDRAGHPDDPRHVAVRDVATLVGPGDVVVVNDTRVLPARVAFARATGGAGEVLLLDRGDDGWWEALVRPSRRVAPGTVVEVGPDLSIEVADDLGEGRRRVRLHTDGPWLDALERHGEMPLPPYLGSVELPDPDRYQTVYSQRPASAAAPTAGLHFTPALLDEVVAAGARLERVELVVGLGTFRPITAEHVEDHVMHGEWYRVPTDTWAACRGAERVVAVGTTSVRALESAAASGRLEGRTELYLSRGSPFDVVDVLMTNFHQPRSSLLVMIDAFVGPRWRDLYATALAEGYRFLSFGDAMWLEPPRRDRTRRPEAS